MNDFSSLAGEWGCGNGASIIFLGNIHVVVGAIHITDIPWEPYGDH